MNGIEIVRQSILFGPFKTEHHSRTVDERFREAFFAFLESKFLPQVDGQFTRVDGRLTSYYDDQKYFGPLSVVKHRYFYEFRLHSAEGTETARGEIDYDPKTATFSESKVRPPHVDSLSRQRRMKDMTVKISSIIERFKAGERGLVCPDCGSVLSVWYLEDRKFVKDISCPTHGCLRVHFD